MAHQRASLPRGRSLVLLALLALLCGCLADDLTPPRSLRQLAEEVSSSRASIPLEQAIDATSRESRAAHAVCTLPNTKIGGDGFMPLFPNQPGQVYLSYHHTYATIVCIDVFAGAFCGRYDALSNVTAFGASGFTYVGSPNQYGGQTMYQGRWMYTTVTAYPVYNVSTAVGANGCTWGILCFDTLLKQFCTSTGSPGVADGAWLPLDFTTQACGQGVEGGLQPYPGQAGKFLTLGPTGTLYCWQPAPTSGQPLSCGTITTNSIPLTLGNAPVLITIGMKIYGAWSYVPQSSTQHLAFLCWDFANSPSYQCAGFGGPVYPARSGIGAFYNLYYPLDMNNNSVAICSVSYYDTDQYDCVAISTSLGYSIGAEITDATNLSWMVQSNWTSGNGTGQNLLPTPYYIGSKMYFGRWLYSGYDCWDWSTRSYCGSAFVPGANFFYQANMDSFGCLWALADSGDVLNFNPSTMVTPCDLGPSPAANNDLYLYTTPVTCTTPYFLDVQANDQNVYGASISIIAGPSGGSATVGTITPYGIYLTLPCNYGMTSFKGYVSLQYTVCGIRYAPSSSTASVAFVASVVAPTSSPITISPARLKFITVDVTSYFTAGTFPIDWSTLTGASSISTGSITYSNNLITFTPANVPPATASFIVQVCDNPALPPASLDPTGLGIRCVNATVTVNPTIDTDGDGVPDVYDIDCDNDGILNTFEAPGLADPIGDVNNDGVINAADTSYASCGGLGRFGWCNNYDLDQDGVANFVDLDSDADTIPDEVEGLSTSFLSGGAGVASLDSDANGMLDGPFYTNGLDSRVQVSGNSGTPNSVYFGSPSYPDTDSDGARDFLDLDSDADGVPDMWESRGLSLTQWAAIDTDFNHVVDTGADTDQDGFEDIVDKTPNAYGSAGIATKLLFADPSTSIQGSGLDRDEDGVPDFRDLDSDNDGVFDTQECALKTLGGVVVSSTYDVVAPFGVIDAEKSGMTDGDKDGIPLGIDSDDTTFGTVYKNLASSGARRELGDADGDGIPDMFDLDSDNDGVSDLVESGNLVALAADTIPAGGGDGKIDGSDTDGDGIKDAADGAINSYGSSSEHTPKDSNSDNIPDMLQLFSLGPAPQKSDLVRSARDPAKYDTNNDGLLDGVADTDFDGIIDATAVGSYTIDIELAFFGGLPLLGPQLPPGGPAVVPFYVPDFQTLTIHADTLFVQGYFPFATSISLSPLTPNIGSNAVSGYTITYTPRRHATTIVGFTITLCDTSPFPICTAQPVTIQPYRFDWAAPISTTTWYMYLPQPLQWNTNLPSNMTATITLYNQAGTQVAIFPTMTTSVTTTTAAWSPHGLLPGIYYCRVVTHGYQAPFDGLQWPDSATFTLSAQRPQRKP